ncbi:MAG: SRPBCC domain-containing protein, partial [Acidimicrobiales bacterium]
MYAATIEREIRIEAPIEVVWNVITNPIEIVKWFADEAEIDLRPGGIGYLKF